MVDVEWLENILYLTDYDNFMKYNNTFILDQSNLIYGYLARL